MTEPGGTQAAVEAQPSLAATAALPPDVMAHVFALLPFNDQHMTVALLCKAWHDWALRQRGGSTSFRPEPRQALPAHAVQDAWDAWDVWPLRGDLMRRGVLVHAARTGDLQLLQWLRAQDPPCPWDEWACTYAAAGGHLGVLQWLRAQSPPCPWWLSGVLGEAQAHRHHAVAQWLQAQGW
jgi:hypothetical protein